MLDTPIVGVSEIPILVCAWACTPRGRYAYNVPMLTATAITALTVLAGPAYTWVGVGSRPTSDARVALMAFLKAYASSTCAFCGEEDANGEACHIVSGGSARRGWVEGNLAYGCRTCNLIDAKEGTIVAFDSIVRPDLVPMAWPTMPELTREGRALKEKGDAETARKRALRGL